MAVTDFQASILGLLAAERRARKESYVAGGVALNRLIAAPRRSRDIDLFHDTTEALQATWEADCKALLAGGFSVKVIREAPAFVEAIVSSGSGTTAMQWVRDSAYRFFPLIEDELLGLTLHPLDLATNKLLALVGRAEPRDWIDAINCDRTVQPLGLLTWAACGKDPGYNPQSLLAHAARRHYAQPEIDALDFGDEQMDAAKLGAQWHAALELAMETCALLPINTLGSCIADSTGMLFQGGPDDLAAALDSQRLVFHEGRIGGAWPTVSPYGPPSA